MPFSLQYDWWNEVVCDDWEVLIHANQNQVFAVWPYHIRKRGIWKLLVQPHFTPYSGLFIKYPSGQKPSTKVSYEQQICKELIDQLPEFSEFKQNFHLQFTNSLPFIWKGFQDLKRFTYLLDLNLNTEVIYDNFRDNVRKQIKKAEKNLVLTESEDSELLKNCFEGSFKSQQLSSPVDDNQIFSRVVKFIHKYGCGKVFTAHDKKDDTHAAICVIWDQQQAYYLIGGSLAQHKNSGALSLLLWQAIQEAKTRGIAQFNFEGSSVPAIEKFFRGFGGDLKTFSCFFKNQSSSLQLARKLKP